MMKSNIDEPHIDAAVCIYMGLMLLKGLIQRLLIPSFSDYLAFTKVRIMSATKEMEMTGGISLDEY
ncbi:MAG: hypothetical protein E7G66_02120 [Veillonella sp.]|jgi:hypothetical protein|uniref:hypothetical protein n=1 Tax=Veillonella sp. TaxID=1926307 RepID=UPI00290F0FCB|nr:hypothetical protein [Veillonella sp.]MDU3819265.1 hypothetical protein [Veillonella sp.]